MNSKWMYWMIKARSGSITAVGGILAVYSFRHDSDGFGYAVVVATVVASGMAFLMVDRKNVRQLQA